MLQTIQGAILYIIKKEQDKSLHSISDDAAEEQGVGSGYALYRKGRMKMELRKERMREMIGKCVETD